MSAAYVFSEVCRGRRPAKGLQAGPCQSFLGNQLAAASQPNKGDQSTGCSLPTCAATDFELDVAQREAQPLPSCLHKCLFQAPQPPAEGRSSHAEYRGAMNEGPAMYCGEQSNKTARLLPWCPVQGASSGTCSCHPHAYSTHLNCASCAASSPAPRMPAHSAEVNCRSKLRKKSARGCAAARRTCCGAATSQPQMHTGSEASTT